jgi:hypothetical protein
METQPRATRTAQGEKIDGPIPARPTCEKCGADLTAAGNCTKGCPPARVVRHDGEGTMHAPRNRRMP